MKKPKAKEPEPRKRGRPSLYNEGLASEILRRMSEGETLIKICSEDGMPSKTTLLVWAINDLPPGFSARYARAREMQAVSIGEEALVLADDCTDPVKARLQVDTRKWFASKMHPSKFGDKSQIEHTGDLPAIAPIFVVPATAESMEAWQKRYKRGS